MLHTMLLLSMVQLVHGRHRVQAGRGAVLLGLISTVQKKQKKTWLFMSVPDCVCTNAVKCPAPFPNEGWPETN